MQNCQIIFKKRPIGVPEPKETFEIVKTTVPSLQENEVLVKNIFLSLDPAMRGWMDDRKSYIAPIKIGEVMRGQTVGEIVKSKNKNFAVGDHVTGSLGWQEYSISNGRGLSKVLTGVPLPTVLGLFGMTGMTAYFGLLEIGKPKPGETVLISGAAGATGCVVGQIAKIKGCRVVGIAGSELKCKQLIEEYGFDGAINYKTGDINKEIQKMCPKGVDIFFDNVGGDILDTALRRINKGARIVICGAISQYNSTQPILLKNYLSLLANSARMEGFIVFDYRKRFEEAIINLYEWMKEGKIKQKEDIVEGLENAPKALLKLFEGSNNGKLLIKITQNDICHRAKL